MIRCFYSDCIAAFLDKEEAAIIGALATANSYSLEITQRNAWQDEIQILKSVLAPYRDRGKVYFEYSIPRLGRRVDVIALIDNVVFAIEFKVGDSDYTSSAVDQVWDYALDLKNFHEPSHDCHVVPILVATQAKASTRNDNVQRTDRVRVPIRCNSENLAAAIHDELTAVTGSPIATQAWEEGRYSPTPTIIEAAMALWGGHSVAEISRCDAGATNLSVTSEMVAQIISEAREKSQKIICFVTGVPGAGKTLVGLNVATKHVDKASALHSVFLSGNGPLVAILREALARDKVKREASFGRKVKKSDALSEVKAFIQNVHHYRDEYLIDLSAPIDHVAIFDEAQRAWNLDQTSKFMKNKKKRQDFAMSEPEFLISCLDRHQDWAVVVCLVGGGQEINTGEGGISEWINALNRRFPEWSVQLSPHLTDSEYAADNAIQSLQTRSGIRYCPELHLATSLRSFRAENVSLLVKRILDLELDGAREVLEEVRTKYPIVITRDLKRAKSWLRERAGGTERYGVVVSSQALRLKPHAIDVRAPVDPVHWFLDGKHDVRSSYYCEDAATEFDVQGLELDWSCVTWDADFRYSKEGWEHWSFRGDKWQRIRSAERQKYLKNAYRVLLTRARQGMVIVIPNGDPEDPTRQEGFYRPMYELLESIGFETI